MTTRCDTTTRWSMALPNATRATTVVNRPPPAVVTKLRHQAPHVTCHGAGGRLLMVELVADVDRP
jgi:hypothetical protein